MIASVTACLQLSILNSLLFSLLFVQDGIGKLKGDIALYQVTAVECVDVDALNKELVFQVTSDLVTICDVYVTYITICIYYNYLLNCFSH